MASGSAQVRVAAGASEEFAQLAWELRRAGAKTLRVELQKGLQRSGRPLIAAVKANARATLPRGGGRGRRRTRLVATGQTLTNQVSGREHAVKERRKIGGKLAAPQSVADRVEGASYSIRMGKGAGGPRLRIVAGERRGRKIDLYRLNKGELRHPLFGRWQSRRGKSLAQQQAVRPGWFTDPIQAHAREFHDSLSLAVARVANEIERG